MKGYRKNLLSSLEPRLISLRPKVSALPKVKADKSVPQMPEVDVPEAGDTADMKTFLMQRELTKRQR